MFVTLQSAAIYYTALHSLAFWCVLFTLQYVKLLYLVLPCVVLSYATLHYLAQCYIKLHFFTLHSLMSHVISVALLYPPLHYIKLLYPMSTYAMSCSLHYNMLHSLAICSVTFPCLALPCVTLCYAPLRWAESSTLLLVNHFLSPEMQHPWLMLIPTGHPLLLVSGGVQQHRHSSCYALNKEKTAWQTITVHPWHSFSPIHHTLHLNTPQCHLQTLSTWHNQCFWYIQTCGGSKQKVRQGGHARQVCTSLLSPIQGASIAHCQCYSCLVFW